MKHNKIDTTGWHHIKVKSGNFDLFLHSNGNFDYIVPKKGLPFTISWVFQESRNDLHNTPNKDRRGRSYYSTIYNGEANGIQVVRENHRTYQSTKLKPDGTKPIETLNAYYIYGEKENEQTEKIYSDYLSFIGHLCKLSQRARFDMCYHPLLGVLETLTPDGKEATDKDWFLDENDINSYLNHRLLDVAKATGFSPKTVRYTYNQLQQALAKHLKNPTPSEDEALVKNIIT
jgi:hypothetical protein